MKKKIWKENKENRPEKAYKIIFGTEICELFGYSEKYNKEHNRKDAGKLKIFNRFMSGKHFAFCILI